MGFHYVTLQYCTDRKPKPCVAGPGRKAPAPHPPSGRRLAVTAAPRSSEAPGLGALRRWALVARPRSLACRSAAAPPAPAARPRGGRPRPNRLPAAGPRGGRSRG
nr:translation initiation factor IF-2-like [Manis javanica]